MSARIWQTRRHKQDHATAATGYTLMGYATTIDGQRWTLYRTVAPRDYEFERISRAFHDASPGALFTILDDVTERTPEQEANLLTILAGRR